MINSIPELKEERAVRADILRIVTAVGTDDEVVKAANYLLEIDEQLNPSKDEPMTWKEPRTLRETVMEMAKQAGMSGNDLLPAELHLQQIENLPPITPFEKRALHMGADPATIYTTEDLKLYQEIKKREAEGWK